MSKVLRLACLIKFVLTSCRCEMIDKTYEERELKYVC